MERARIERPLLVVLLIHFCLWLPAFVTLQTVDVVRPVMEIGPYPGPSPHGYTWSLTLWGVPALAILISLARAPGRSVSRKAFLLTIVPLLGLGVVLDFAFGNLFFIFPNPGAALGIFAPGWDWASQSILWNIPLEEFFFYFFGDSVALLIYLWCDLYWLDRYASPEPYRYQAGRHLLRISWWPLLLGAAMILAAWAYKAFFSDVPDGFPGYFAFLVVVAFVPATLFLTMVADRINWQAYASAALTMFFISLIWECTIAFPYGWWAYKPDMMMGMYIRAWSNLPVEEPFLWLLVTFSTVLSYETVRALVQSDESPSVTIFGEGAATRK